MKSFNELPEIMISIVSTLTEKNAEIYNVKAQFESIKKETKLTFSESKRYWEEKSKADMKELLTETKKRSEDIDKKVRGLESLEEQLYKLDRSYAKRRDCECDFNCHIPIVTSFSESEFNKIHNEAVSLAKECSLTVKAKALQEIGMIFSKVRKKKYIRFLCLVKQAKQMHNIFENEIQNKVYQLRTEIYKKKKEEIQIATDQTAELLKEVEHKEKERIANIESGVLQKLNTIITDYDLETIRQMRDLYLMEPHNLPASCSEYISIGKFFVEFGDIIQYQNIVEILNQKFEGFIERNGVVFPAIFDLRDSGNFIVKQSPYIEHSFIINIINSLIYSYLINEPASMHEFKLVDPIGGSKSYFTYLAFIKNFQDVMGNRISSTKEEIKNILDELCEHIDICCQSRFVGHDNIFEYNLEATKMEPLRCLSIMDFPKCFDVQMLDELYRIVHNGKECGVHVIIHYSDEENRGKNSEQYNTLLNKINGECTILEYRENNWKMNNGIQLKMLHSPTLHELKSFEDAFQKQYIQMKNTSLSFDSIAPKEQWNTRSSLDKLEIPIGKNENNKIQFLCLGEGTSHHALIIGSLGSGKSTLLHTIIMSAITSFSPDELNLYLMDFKSGTEFKVYAGKKIPHIKLIVLDAMQEFGQSILDNIWDIMQRRVELFGELISEGYNVKDIEEYRMLSGKKMPRIVIIVDEFQMLFSEEHNRKIAAYCGMKFADFISLSRVYGIHFIMSTQTMSRLTNGFSVKKSTLNEMYVRIGLKCTEQESVLLFGDRNGKMAFNKMRNEKGIAVYVGDYVQGIPKALKVAYCKGEQQELIINELENRYSLFEPKERTQVFSGNSIPTIMNCKGLWKTEITDKATMIYLGEPIKIAKPVSIRLSRMKRNNLLIVGSNPKMMDQLIALYMLNVQHFNKNEGEFKKAEIYLFDGLSTLGEELSHDIGRVCEKSKENVMLIKDNYKAVQVIDNLYDEYQKRKKKLAEGVSNFCLYHILFNDFCWIDSIQLMLSGKNINEYTKDQKPSQLSEKRPPFDYFEPREKHPNNLTDMMNDFCIELTSTVNQLEKKNISHKQKIMSLIDSGYTVGMNVVMSCQDYVAIKEYIYDVIPKFPNRIIFALSNLDADRLIQDARPEQLRENMAIFYDSVNTALQFKPYGDLEEYYRD